MIETTLSQKIGKYQGIFIKKCFACVLRYVVSSSEWALLTNEQRATKAIRLYYFRRFLNDRYLLGLLRWEMREWIALASYCYADNREMATRGTQTAGLKFMRESDVAGMNLI